MTKTDLPNITAGDIPDMQSPGDPSPAIDDFENNAGDAWFCFRHNFSKINRGYLQNLKIVSKDAPRDSLQSVLKIRV